MNNNVSRLSFEENKLYVITSPYSLRYYTGFCGEGVAVLSRDKCWLITDSRYTEAAESEAVGFEIKEGTPYFSRLGEIFKECGAKIAAVEENHLSAGAFAKLKAEYRDIAFEFASSETEALRMVKSEEEIGCIRKAEKIASDAYEHILGVIKEGVTEAELAAEIEYYMKRLGAEKTSFDTIVISGKKTSMPHGTPSDKKICRGDFITMDFGCVYKGYCSDMTRTVVFGEASDRQREIYGIVLKAQETALDFLRSGVKASEADAAARKIISNAGYGKNFGHSLGHGTGLLIHEAPSLSPKSDIILKENMVVSCEPGIYIPDFGGVRIEDLVVIKDGGIENLTPCEKKFTEIL